MGRFDRTKNIFGVYYLNYYYRFYEWTQLPLLSLFFIIKRRRQSNLRANLQTAYILCINQRILGHNKKVSAEQNNNKYIKCYGIFHACISIPRWPCNVGAQISTHACAICTQRASKMDALAKKKSQIYQEIFCFKTFLNEKCSFLIGSNARFFKMKINGVAQTLYRLARIQQTRESAILGIFTKGLKK